MKLKSRERVFGLILVLWGALYLVLSALGINSTRLSGILFLSLFIVATAAVIFISPKRLKRKPGEDLWLRGAEFMDYYEAERKSKRLKDDKPIWWGMLDLPQSLSTTHFLVSGTTGSGKTMTLRLLMQSVLPRITKGSDWRAVVYDAKQDTLSILGGMGVGCPIITLNPFDTRGAAWDIAKDVTSPAVALQVASILIPENKQSTQPYFSEAARHILTGVMISFIKRLKGDWTFRDVVIAMRDKDTLKSILAKLPDTAHVVKLHFYGSQTTENVMSTIATYMRPFEIIAAAWDKASSKISLQEFIDGEFILVLGNDERIKVALDSINRVLFQRLTQLVLASSESDTRRTWVFFDEVMEVSEFKALNRLLTKGRSKGASVVIGFQDIEGLRAAYGKEQANELVGLCANKALLRTDSPETAKWCAEVLGQREVLETRQSEGSSNSYSIWLYPGRSTAGRNASTTEHVVKKDLMLPSEFMKISPTTPENGLEGVYVTPLVGTYCAKVHGAWIEQRLCRPDPNTPNAIHRPPEDEYLRPWDREDLKRLGLASDETCDEELAEKEDALMQVVRPSLDS